MADRTLIIARAESVLAKISSACIIVASCALVVLIVTFGWLVFGRYVLNVTPTWVEQLALVLIGYIAFLGAAAGVYDDSHLGVTMFRDAAGERIRTFIMVIVDIVLAIFGVVMFLAGLELVQFGWDTNLPMLNVPESVRTFSMVCCGGLMTLFVTARIIIRISKFSQPANAELEEGR